MSYFCRVKKPSFFQGFIFICPLTKKVAISLFSQFRVDLKKLLFIKINLE